MKPSASQASVAVAAAITATPAVDDAAPEEQKGGDDNDADEEIESRYSDGLKDEEEQ